MVTLGILGQRRMLLWLIRYGLAERYRAKLSLPRRVELNAEDVACTTPESATHTKWCAVEKIASTRDYLFIYESPHPTAWYATTWNALAGQIIIVPRRAFDDDERFREFVETAHHLYEQGKAELMQEPEAAG
jgi:hypothetical protein